MQDRGKTNDKADFFDELRFWSRIKLRILEKYLDAYIRKRGGFNPKIVYVDGFAGQGIYGSDGQSEEGSPVRIARFAQRISDEQRPYRLLCLNTEIDKQRCAALRKSLAGFESDIVQTFCGSFNDLLPDLLR